MYVQYMNWLVRNVYIDEISCVYFSETEMYGADSDFDYQDTLAPVQGKNYLNCLI